MLPPDIEENILAALNTLFTYHLISIPTYQNDPLVLKRLGIYPLQDDITLVSPYVVYAKHPEKGTVRMDHHHYKEYGDAEIGGPLRYLSYYYAKIGTPVATTREQCNRDINNLMARVMSCLVTYYTLSGLDLLQNSDGAMSSPDLSQVIEDANQRLIDESKTHIFGGETTWYGEGELCWHYPVSWYPQDRIL